MESLLSKVRETSAFCNSVEKSNMSKVYSVISTEAPYQKFTDVQTAAVRVL